MGETVQYTPPVWNLERGLDRPVAKEKAPTFYIDFRFPEGIPEPLKGRISSFENGGIFEADTTAFDQSTLGLLDEDFAWEFVSRRPSSRGVFEVQADNSRAIIKLQRNVAIGRLGRSNSSQEFDTAKELSSRRLSIEGITATWEKPLGMITSQNKKERGVVFKYIDGIQNTDSENVERIVTHLYDRLRTQENQPQGDPKVEAFFQFYAAQYLLHLTMEDYYSDDNNFSYDIFYSFPDDGENFLEITGFDVEFSKGGGYVEIDPEKYSNIQVFNGYAVGTFNQIFGEQMTDAQKKEYHQLAKDFIQKTKAFLYPEAA